MSHGLLLGGRIALTLGLQRFYVYSDTPPQERPLLAKNFLCHGDPVPVQRGATRGSNACLGHWGRRAYSSREKLSGRDRWPGSSPSWVLSALGRNTEGLVWKLLMWRSAADEKRPGLACLGLLPSAFAAWGDPNSPTSTWTGSMLCWRLGIGPLLPVLRPLRRQQLGGLGIPSARRSRTWKMRRDWLRQGLLVASTVKGALEGGPAMPRNASARCSRYTAAYTHAIF